MNFVVIGNDAHAEAFTRAALARGDRALAVFAAGTTFPNDWADLPRLPQLDDLNALPKLDYLVLAGDLAGRAERLQWVLRIDPVDLVVAIPAGKDLAAYYELSLLQAESQIRVLPLIPELFHPLLPRIRELLASAGTIRWVEWQLPLDPGEESHRFLSGWVWLAELTGAIVEVTPSSANDHRAAPVLISVKTSRDLLVSVRYQPEARGYRMQLDAQDLTLTCQLPDGWDGPARLSGTNSNGDFSEEYPALPAAQRWTEAWANLGRDQCKPLWNHATRQLEIAEAVQRGLHKQRTVSLVYDEVSEEAAFKSIMTSMGCSIIWGMILVLVLAAMGVPFIAYLIPCALIAFLLLHSLGAAVLSAGRQRALAMSGAAKSTAKSAPRQPSNAAEAATPSSPNCPPNE